MKMILLSLMILMTTARCGKKAVADTTAPVTPTPTPTTCKCEVKLSEPVWRYGELCKKGELSQGSARNPQGYVVAACVTLKSECAGSCPAE